MASLVDACIFIASSAGTGDFVVASARPGWRTPAQASAANGATYRYRAYSDDQSEWEVGTGVYTVGTTTLTRVVILDSSNAGAAVNFTAAPNVALTVFSADYATEGQLAKIDFITVTGAVDLDALGTASTRDTGVAAGNVPVLDGAGLLDTSILPALAINDVFVVGSQAAMLALTAQRGDIAIRTDLDKSFALSTDDPTTLADWKELLTPTDAVLSVAGLTGAISAGALEAALALVETVTGDDSVAVDNTDPKNPVVSLENDDPAPGNDKVYGTSPTGVRGWKDDPGGGGVESGTKMLFVQAAAPTDWTKDVDQNDKAIRIVSGTGGGAAGTSPFSTVFGKTATDNHTLTTAQLASHVHTRSFYGGGATDAPGAGAFAFGVTTTPNNNSAGSNNAHSHGMDIRVQYVDVIKCTKD